MNPNERAKEVLATIIGNYVIEIASLRTELELLRNESAPEEEE